MERWDVSYRVMSCLTGRDITVLTGLTAPPQRTGRTKSLGAPANQANTRISATEVNKGLSIIQIKTGEL